MQIGPWRFQVHPGMVVAAVLLAVGGTLFLASGDDDPALRTLGFGLVVVSSVVYLGTRILMIVRARRT